MADEIQTSAEAVEGAMLAELYAVQVDKHGNVQKEQQAAQSKKPISQKSPAEWAYERIVMYIQNFEKTLDGEHEVGMGFAGSDAGSLKIQGMGYFAPDIVTFYGTDMSGNKMQLVQHVSQLNVMLVAEPKAEPEEEPVRIGFKLAQELEEKA
ncbi:MAG: DUF6173 family protein [Pseudomonadota bacterium]